MKILSVKISEPLHSKLSATARARGESRSTLVREAIEAFIENNASQPSGSCLELAKDLVGAVKGASDLSFNKKHMRDYGQ